MAPVADRKVGQQLDELRDWSLSHVNLDPRLHKELADIMEKAYQRDVFSEAQVRLLSPSAASQNQSVRSDMMACTVLLLMYSRVHRDGLYCTAGSSPIDCV